MRDTDYASPRWVSWICVGMGILFSVLGTVAAAKDITAGDGESSTVFPLVFLVLTSIICVIVGILSLRSANDDPSVASDAE